MPAEPPPPPSPQPPAGVPRWFWPPPGAIVRDVVLREDVREGAAHYTVREGEAPEPNHLRALQWLLDEHTRGELPEGGAPFEGEVLLQIAETQMPGGRVGHAYALNRGPIGAPSGDPARGILWRWIEARVDGGA